MGSEKMKSILSLLILSVFFMSHGIFTEEYSIRKKKPPGKKPEISDKKNQGTAPVNGFSRENNRISNLYWLEDSALFLPDFIDNSPGEVIPETPATPPVKTDIQSPPIPSQEENPPKQQPEKDKQNIVLQFLMENKKILLIITLLIIFAVYRLRGNTPSYTNQGRIFSKFRNK